MSQNGKKGTGKSTSKNLKAGKSGGTEKGIRSKPVPKRSKVK